MCLAVPGRVVKWLEREPPFAQATVEFAGVRRTVSMDCVLDAAEDDYVLVHAGVAISSLSAHDAQIVLQTLAELGLDDDDPVDDEGRT